MKDWKFSHNFVDAGAMIQSAFINTSDPSLQLNILDKDGNAFLFKNEKFVCAIPRLTLQ